MMPTRFNKMTSAVAALILLLNLTAPALAHNGEETAAVNKPAKAKPEQSFCSRIDVVVAKIDRDVADKDSKLKDRQSDKERIKDHRADTDGKVSDDRVKHDSENEARFSKLDALATTDAQKAAIQTFKTAILNAINARRTAVDAARTAFQSGIDAAQASRRVAVENARLTFTKSVSDATAKAKTDCASGVSAETVKVNFRSDLKSAQLTLRKTIKSVAKTGDAVKTLVRTRQDAFKKAQADFQAAVDKAKTDLKIALGENAPAASGNQTTPNP